MPCGNLKPEGLLTGEKSRITIHTQRRPLDWRRLSVGDQEAVCGDDFGGLEFSKMPYKVLSLLVGLKIPVLMAGQHDGGELARSLLHGDFPCRFGFQLKKSQTGPRDAGGTTNRVHDGGVHLAGESLVAIGIHKGKRHGIPRLFDQRPRPLVIADKSAVQRVWRIW